MHLVGFIIRIYHNAQSPEHQITLMTPQKLQIICCLYQTNEISHLHFTEKSLTSQEVPCFLMEGTGGGKDLLTLAESATNSSCAEDIMFGHQQRSYVSCFIFMFLWFFHHSTVPLQK